MTIHSTSYFNSSYPHYGLMVGQNFLTISQKTDKVDEAVTLRKYLHEYTSTYKSEFEEAFLKESLKMPSNIEDALQGAVEDFLKLWNQLVLNKGLEQLVLFPPLFKDLDEGFGYPFYTYEVKPGMLEIGLNFTVVPSQDGKSIASASVSMYHELAYDPEMWALFKECVKNLIEVVEPEARVKGAKLILTELGTDEEISNFNFFNMTGIYRYNGVGYMTLGPEGEGGSRYTLLVTPDSSPNTIYSQRRYVTKPSQ